MKISNYLIGLLALTLLMAGCKDEYANGPQIKWLSHSGSTTMTYNYSGGVLSGVSLYVYFTVIEDTGEIKLEVSGEGSSKSCVASVEEGNDYTVRITCGIGSEGSSSKLTLDCPSANESFTLNVSGYSVNLSSITCYLKE